MYKKLMWMFALTFSFILSQSAFAGSHCHGGFKSMIESLKLDDTQKEKVKPILEQLKTTMKASWTQMKGLETQISQQVTSATMDQNAVNALVDQKTKLIGDMIKAKIAAKNQIYNLLNDQQKATLQAKMKDFEEKMAAKFKDCHDDD
ncbi:periplasmic protein [Legionella massiliensis]|uniref:Periplasmic protein n=1 Tax=Legionella massiliensis TaxID=1034943 RepID=A0A078KRR0_9GAMM|nr:Spy/CpxP family protein refolding chaperone [Legionella massiliensis]CDZ75776.1 periplasmic protein [Legionella massiliensis]CEE11514.1 periplasmic protein [Legionella massiliensis]